MKRQLLAVFFLGASSAVVLASGYEKSSTSTSTAPVQNGGTYERQPLGRPPEQTTTTTQANIAIVQEPYNLGQAIYAQKYNLGTPKLSESNVAEKKLRLQSLQRLLPAAGQKSIHPEMAARMTNRQLNALEYFVAVKFKTVLNKPPTWARQDPPVKITFSK